MRGVHFIPIGGKDVKREMLAEMKWNVCLSPVNEKMWINAGNE